MTLENKMISSRQSFRMGILENITLGMVVIPYATVNLAGRWHFVAFLLGLLLGAVYMGLIYYLSVAISKNVTVNRKQVIPFGKVASLLYLLRFVLRGGLIMYFFGKTVQEFLLQSFSLWTIIIVFAIVCGYGAARDVEKRGRMLELLFPWMIIPIILVAVFSISSINLEELYSGLMGVNYDLLHEAAGATDVLRAGYVAFLITTSTELMLFTLPHERENNWRNALKTGLWILISIFLAYIFIIGILGGHWVASDSQAALNVMEAAFIPGEVIERADYPVLAFWIIGVFAIISGYIFYAKEAFLVVGGLKDKKQGRVGLWIVIAGVVILTWLWSIENIATHLAKYMLWADVAISILLPVLLLVKKSGKKIFVPGSWTKKTSLLMAVAIASCLVSGCGNKEFKPLSRQQSSIENRDYVTHITFKGDDEIIFAVADIKKYLSDATGDFETKEEKVREDSLEDALEKYYEDKGRQLDLGHLSGITFQNIKEDDLREYVLEMSSDSSLGKSVTVIIEDKDKSKEIPLRDLIKNAYSGENFP